MDDAKERLAAARVAHLATVGGDGRPHVVPFCFVLDGTTLYSAVDEKPKSTLALRRLDNVRANPSAAVVADHYDENWDELWWVRVSGRARVIEDGPERDRAVELLAAKYPQYRLQRPRGAVLAVEVERWASWSASGS